MRRSRIAAACALALAGGAATAPTTAGAHEGDSRYRSTITAVSPAPPGLRVQVLNFDDRLLVVNDTGREVVVEGYEREPYLRFGADGGVWVNRRSSAAYLNDDRDGDAPIPAFADARAAPDWRPVSRDRRHEFHDHRMHWMGEGLPPQVTDEDARAKVFDYRIPIAVGGREGAIRGTLTWVGTPGGGGPPAAATAGLAALVLLAGGAVVVRRRRGRRPVQTREAW